MEELRSLTLRALDGLAQGVKDRNGPLPSGGAHYVATRTLEALGDILPNNGTNPTETIYSLAQTVAWSAADPHHPHTIAHLQCPPRPEAIAADLVVNALNPSLDSWDQAPGASVIERVLCTTICPIIYPEEKNSDSIITSGGTESNLIALLVAREKLGTNMQVIVGENSHHSVYRSCWILGIATPLKVSTPSGIIDLAALKNTLQTVKQPVLIVATAGTTDEGLIDPIPQIIELAHAYNAEVHIDAAYGGMLLFTPKHSSLLAGIDQADSVTLDFHKLSFQPIAASALVVRGAQRLKPLTVQADYLNAIDDSAAGIPDVLDRSIRTSRRLDALKVVATWKTLGKKGLANAVNQCISNAQTLADLLDQSGKYERPHTAIGISTVLFRPINARSPEHTTQIRRFLLTNGTAVLGRARLSDNSIWLKATLLNPATSTQDLKELIDKIDHAATEVLAGQYFMQNHMQSPK